MMQDWTEFTGTPREVRMRNPRVTLGKYKDIYLNLKAYEALGSPERIRFFYDTARKRIGLRKSSPEDNNSFPVKKEPGSGAGATVHAAYFCNNSTTTASNPTKPSNSPRSPSTPTASWSST